MNETNLSELLEAFAKRTPGAILPEKDDSNKITREFLDSFMLEYRYIDGRVPDMTTEIFGKNFSSPIMIGGMSAMVPKLHKNGMLEFAKSAAELNLVNFVGYVKDDVVEQLTAVGAKTVRIIKLQADTERVLQDIKHDEDCGCFAYALDIDHVFGKDGRNYVSGTPDYGNLAPRTVGELRDIIASSKLPCVLKGVLSVTDAEKAVNAGASAILISHHKGEIPCAVPPAYVLPEIKAAVGDKIKIFADCGICSGIDAFKVLAMGADAVCVARNLLNGYIKNGSAGISGRLTELNDELRTCMARTCTYDAKHFDRTCLRKKNW